MVSFDTKLVYLGFFFVNKNAIKLDLVSFSGYFTYCWYLFDQNVVSFDPDHLAALKKPDLILGVERASNFRARAEPEPGAFELEPKSSRA